MHPDNQDFRMIDALNKNWAVRREIHARFIKGRWENGSDEDIRFLALELAGEAGELANLIKKEWRGDVIDQTKIFSEMADVYNYLMHLADIYAVDLVDESNRKYVEVDERLRAQGK